MRCSINAAALMSASWACTFPPTPRARWRLVLTVVEQQDPHRPCHCCADSGTAPLPVVRLQGHCAPTVAVAWAFDERRLASSDCDGTVIVWKREHAVADTNDDPY